MMNTRPQTEWSEFTRPLESISTEQSQSSPTITNEHGGRQSNVERAYHLVPPDALAQVARVLHLGYLKYGRDNWRLIGSDDHLNHALNHIYLHLAKNTQEDHLAHAATRVLMALELEVNPTHIGE